MPAKGTGRPLAVRFLAQLPQGQPDECWEWAGARLRTGYGVIKSEPVDGSARMLKAHRVAYEHFVGPIPDGALICHHCDNPPCCNPRHLYAGNASTNARDAYARGRAVFLGFVGGDKHNAAKTHCPQGHPYDEANTLWWRNGHHRDGRPRWARRCATCRADRRMVA